MKPETDDAPMEAQAGPDVAVGERIRAARIARGLTQGDLAALVGVSRSAVAQWETDRSGQVRRNLTRVAAILGMAAVDLLGAPGAIATGGLRDSPELPPGAPSRADEMALLRLYRECAEPDRALLLRTAMRLARSADVQAEERPRAVPGPPATNT